MARKLSAGMLAAADVAALQVALAGHGLHFEVRVRGAAVDPSGSVR